MSDWDDDPEEFEDEDSDDEPKPTPALGACCICMQENPSVRNIVMLDLRAPKEGDGCWGCVQCGLPMAGAVAVLCDHCLVELQAGRRDVALACVGHPGANERIRIQLLTEAFEHDMSKHQEIEGWPI
jgi:hypothetical protein